jgi:hypothetical protein
MLGGDELTETWNDFSYFEDDADDDEAYEVPITALMAIDSGPASFNARMALPNHGPG